MTVIAVTVVVATPDKPIEIEIELESGATVADALLQSNIAARYAPAGSERTPVGIHGRRVARDTALLDGDRVEVYRSLVADPKDARRTRAARRRDSGLEP